MVALRASAPVREDLNAFRIAMQQFDIAAARMDLDFHLRKILRRPRRGDEGEVNQKLEKVMVKAFEDVHSTATKYSADMRTGAYILAIDRVAKATSARGIWP